MKKVNTIAIGIPTYEAGESLISTLNSIYEQEGFAKVSKVILMLDGSRLKKSVYLRIKNPKLKIVTSETRNGQSARINDIFKISKADLLFLTNDDVIWGRGALKYLIQTYQAKNADLIASNVHPLKAVTLLELLLKVGIDINRYVFTNWNKADNYLACNGRLIVLSRSLYKKMTVPANILNNDAFIYLYVKINKYKFSFSERAVVYFRSPGKLSDHIKQSSKFKYSKVDNSRHLNKNLDNYYQVPTSLLAKAVLKEFLTRPFLVLGYIGVVLMTKLKEVNYSNRSETFWETDLSTKVLEVNRK